MVEDPAYRETIAETLSEGLPVLSITVSDDAFFGPDGIYSNPQNSGADFEVPIELEYSDPADLDATFRLEAGIRIHGGNARDHPKKPFRLYFRDDYGGKLRFPMFKDSPVDSFRQLVLREGGHDGWSLAGSGFEIAGLPPNLWIPPHASFLRDQFIRRTEVEMGVLSPRGKYVYVYINQRFWGLYDLHERPNADFFSDHLGGVDDDWDVMHHPETFAQDHVVVNGNDTAWVALQELADKGVSSDADYEAMQQYLDMPDYIDSLVPRIWSGDFDWAGPMFIGGEDVTVFNNKNWYAGRRSRGEAGKFKVFTWDA
ncbi:MAG: CotH kinase family protein, partial [Verrucomicrobiota bacterium]